MLFDDMDKIVVGLDELYQLGGGSSEHFEPITQKKRQKFKVGDKVYATNKKEHEQFPNWYPCVGTIGTIEKFLCCGIRVQWKDGSTSGNDTWQCAFEDVELCEPETKTDKFDIKNVWFNEEKRTTVVKWADSTVTKAVCGNKDTFNQEVGLSICFMKRALDGKKTVNDVLHKYCKGTTRTAKLAPTKEQQAYLQEMANKGYPWCAKDSDGIFRGGCWFFKEKPKKFALDWMHKHCDFTASDLDFPFLSWDDAEPYYTKPTKQKRKPDKYGFAVGDKVVVVRSGQTYSLYRHGDYPHSANAKFKEDFYFNDGTVCVITASYPHCDGQDHTLYTIEADGHCVAVNELGIKLADK